MKHVPTEEMFSGWSAFFASQTSKDDHRSSQRLRNHWVVHLDPAKIARCHFLDVTLWGVTFKSTKLYENLGVYIQIKMLDSVGPCFVIWSKNSNFLSLTSRVVWVKNIFHASANLRELYTSAKILTKKWKQCISCIFLMINAHVWQINFEKFMFNTDKWNKNIGNKELLDHVFAVWNKNNNFLTFLLFRTYGNDVFLL